MLHFARSCLHIRFNKLSNNFKTVATTGHNNWIAPNTDLHPLLILPTVYLR